MIKKNGTKGGINASIKNQRTRCEVWMR